MQKRKQIINEVAPSLVISIHQNYYPSSSVKGAQVFYSDKQEKSKEYAEKMQSSLNGFLSQNKQSKLADYYILQCSVYPTMLIECGFVSNASDLKNLLNPSYRERFSREIARVVDEILLNPR
jgi:N-acetylmuramoyl-L-alanine amidase